MALGKVNWKTLIYRFTFWRVFSHRLSSSRGDFLYNTLRFLFRIFLLDSHHHAFKTHRKFLYSFLISFFHEANFITSFFFQRCCFSRMNFIGEKNTEGWAAWKALERNQQWIIRFIVESFVIECFYGAFWEEDLVDQWPWEGNNLCFVLG